MTDKYYQKNILVICPYPEGFAASQRLKYEQYFEKWRNDGFNVTVSSFFSFETWKILYEKGYFLSKVCGTIKGYFRRIRDLKRLKDFDCVYVCMWVTPLIDTLFESLYTKRSKKLIFDFDDSIHMESDPNNRNFLKRILKNKKKIQLLIERSNDVITSSPYNLEYCKNNNIYNSATYIPCSLDASRFFPKKIKDDKKKLTLGWTGTFTSSSYLDSIREELKIACQKYNLKLLLITNFDYDIPDIDIEVIRWTKETEIIDLQRIDIGLYPLIPSNWAKGKGGLKVLQYMSIGIPSISTNFGTATHIIENGVTGYLVDDHQEWIEKIGLLVADYEMRKNMGQLARKKIMNTYSTEAVSPIYLNILNGLKNDHRK